MNKTAKEMFEELGYRCLESEYDIQYIKRSGSSEETIRFDKQEKCYTCFEWHNSRGICCLYIYKKINKAIQQQIKELGW